MPRLLSILITVVLAVAIVTLGRWYFYISNTTSPYDEVGIELNSRMPYPLRKYGCGKLQATFVNALPPYGCGDDQGRWI